MRRSRHKTFGRLGSRRRGGLCCMSAGVCDRKAAGLDRAGPGDLGQAAGRGHHVAGEEHAVAAVDRGPVAPGLARRSPGRRCARPSPGAGASVSRSRQPANEASSSRSSRAAARVRRLAGPDRHLGLDQLLAVRRQRLVGRRVALRPSPSPGGRRPRTGRRAGGSAPGPGRRHCRSATSATRRRAAGARRPARWRRSRWLAGAASTRVPVSIDDPEPAAPACSRSTIARPAADRIPRGRRAGQQPADERLPHEGRRQLAGIVVIGEDAGAAGQRSRRPPRRPARWPRCGSRDRRAPSAAQAQRRHRGADGGNAADVVVPAKSHARQRGPGVRGQQVALARASPRTGCSTGARAAPGSPCRGRPCSGRGRRARRGPRAGARRLPAPRRRWRRSARRGRLRRS